MRSPSAELLADLGLALTAEALLQVERGFEALYEYLTGDPVEDDEELLRQAARERGGAGA